MTCDIPILAARTHLAANSPQMAKRLKRARCNCPLCTHATLPQCLRSTPTWLQIIRVVFWCLRQLYPEVKYYSLRDHVYTFIEDHWDLICQGKKRKDNWRKSLQDTLSHADCVQSGKKAFGQNGYWAATELRDPWNPLDFFPASSKPKGRPPKSRVLPSPKSIATASPSALHSPLHTPHILHTFTADAMEPLSTPLSTPLASTQLCNEDEIAAVILSSFSSPRSVASESRVVLPSLNI